MDGMRLELFGNLGRDPESRYTPQGKMVTTVSVAVTMGYGDNKKTEWIKATLWEKNAELFHKLTQKGTMVWLSGTPKVSTWNGKDDGEAKAQMEITVREFRILKGFAKKEEADEGEPEFMQE